MFLLYLLYVIIAYFPYFSLLQSLLCLYNALVSPFPEVSHANLSVYLPQIDAKDDNEIDRNHGD